MFPIILICFIIFVVFLNSRKRQITKQEQEITEQFWARENKANATRRRSLDNLPYITIPEELLTPRHRHLKMSSPFMKHFVSCLLKNR